MKTNGSSIISSIAGDIIGSRFEFANIKTTDFPLFTKGCRFTDDTVLTCAIADALMRGRHYSKALLTYAHQYPRAGYGGGFKTWVEGRGRRRHSSFGNGSAMRVSPIGLAFDSLDEVLRQAKRSAMPSHNHPEGIKGAQAVAAAVYLARIQLSKDEIKRYVQGAFGYELSVPLDDIRTRYFYNAICQETVPQAIRCFLEAEDFEQAVRLAVSLGGDSDTLACIAGSIAGAFFGVPRSIERRAMTFLDDHLRGVVREFNEFIRRRRPT